MPHPARVYDYWLGGKDNYRADREAAAEAVKIFPKTVESARSCRAFLSRVVIYLTAEAGIRQFLDLGSGLPSAQNVHEVAQAIAPQSRVVYVDHDPVVMLHAQALLTSTAPGVTDYIEADLRDPAAILAEALPRSSLMFFWTRSPFIIRRRWGIVLEPSRANSSSPGSPWRATNSLTPP